MKDESINRKAKTLIKSFFDAIALGSMLALVDASLSTAPTLWTLNEADSLFWLAVMYSLGVLLVGALARNRVWTVGLVVGMFFLGRGGLWFYRGDNSAGLQLRDVVLLGILGLGSILLGRVASRLSRSLKAGSTFAIIASVAVATAGLLGWFQHSGVSSAPPLEEVVPSGTSQGGDPGSRPNLLLLTLDTVRPDHLSAYGYTGVSTPNIDALAREGVLFSRAMAQASFTPPSHASILTGVYPSRHGLRGFAAQNRVVESQSLLSEILRSKGYQTGAMIASTTLDPAFGLDRGFDLYHYPVPFGGYLFSGFQRSLLPTLLHFTGLVKDKSAYRRGQLQTADAIRWLDAHSMQPFFLWVHYFDAHDPYFPSRRSQSREVHHESSWFDRFRPAYKYDSEILDIDSYVGNLVSYLRSEGLLDETIVVVVSDHGEGLADHGYYGHTARLYQEQLRSVLLIRYPLRLPQGVTIRTQVRNIDVLPTVLDLMDLRDNREIDGASLLPLLESDGLVDRMAIAETMAPPAIGNRLVAVSDGQYKLILSLAGKEWLFDLAEDPGETRNLVAELPTVVDSLRSYLSSHMAHAPSEPDEREPLNKNLLERLHSLGYIN